MRLVFPILALSATAAAQLTIIPSAVATVRPTLSPFYTNTAFYSTTSTTTQSASHAQQIIDCADIAAPGAVWTSLEVRRPIGLGNQNPALTTNATIVMSVSPMSWQSATNTFATNHGPNQVTVVSGNISLPAAINQAAWPAPWQPPIPFSVPFAYGSIAGGSLVIDIRQDQGATPAGMQGWYLEYTTPDVGGRFENGGPQSNCRFSTAANTYNNGISYTTAGLGGNGGNWFVQYNASPGGFPVNAIGIGAIGANGHGGAWNGIPLSIDLAGLGAPGCRWSTSMEIVFGLVATGTAPATARMPNVTIPADPALRGTSFYDHALFLDPAANAAGFVTTWSSRWAIGTQIGAPGAYVSVTGNGHMNATGTLTRGGAITLQLQ